MTRSDDDSDGEGGCVGCGIEGDAQAARVGLEGEHNSLWIQLYAGGGFQPARVGDGEAQFEMYWIFVVGRGE